VSGDPKARWRTARNSEGTGRPGRNPELLAREADHDQRHSASAMMSPADHEKSVQDSVSRWLALRPELSYISSCGRPVWGPVASRQASAWGPVAPGRSVSKTGYRYRRSAIKGVLLLRTLVGDLARNARGVSAERRWVRNPERSSVYVGPDSVLPGFHWSS
jgi:hypothetical protein